MPVINRAGKDGETGSDKGVAEKSAESNDGRKALNGVLVGVEGAATSGCRIGVAGWERIQAKRRRKKIILP